MDAQLELGLNRLIAANRLGAGPPPAACPGEDRAEPGQAGRQVSAGQAQLPPCCTVKPNELPLPLGRAVITLPLESQVAVVFQVAMTRWGDDTVTVTIQLLVPLTVTWPLKRSFHFWPSL
jgi:hypothetical protein